MRATWVTLQDLWSESSEGPSPSVPNSLALADRKYKAPEPTPHPGWTEISPRRGWAQPSLTWGQWAGKEAEGGETELQRHRNGARKNSWTFLLEPKSTSLIWEWSQNTLFRCLGCGGGEAATPCFLDKEPGLGKGAGGRQALPLSRSKILNRERPPEPSPRNAAGTSTCQRLSGGRGTGKAAVRSYD